MGQLRPTKGSGHAKRCVSGARGWGSETESGRGSVNLAPQKPL